MARMLRICVLALAAMALPLAAQVRPQPAEPRIALVIGNAQYRDSPLNNAVNDARAIAAALTKAGFKVTERENLGQRDMQNALRDFGDALKSGGVGLFYYAGHGVQVKGRNYLIPIDARIEREDEIAYNSLDANQVLDKMEAAGNRLNIVILDACRNNPFPRSFRSSTTGLAQMDAPAGTLVAFATAPGAVASDGNGQNGLYTQHLLQAMQQPGTKIEDVFKSVRAAVRRDSQGRQVPWENTSLEGDFVFVALPPAPVSAAPPTATTATEKFESVPAPTYVLGDTWTVQNIDLFTGSVTGQTKISVTASSADELRFGGFVFDKSLNMLRNMKDGKVVEKWTPKRPHYEFPLHVGRTWSAVATYESDKLISEHTFTFKVIRQERVAVPAGVFDTFRIEGASKYKTTMKKDGASGEGSTTRRFWYSPVVGRHVAFEYEETNWKGIVSTKTREELVAYTRAAR